MNFFEDTYKIKIVNPEKTKIMCDEELKLRIVTHDGIFHCDELAALVVLQWCPFIRNNNCFLIRTRDETIIKKPGGIIIDIGNSYRFDSDEMKNFGKTDFTQYLDHHQSDFKEKWTNLLNGKNYHSNNMAAFGLVLKHFGVTAFTELIKIWNYHGYTSFDLSKIEELVERFYSSGFGKKIDSVDNSQYMEHVFLKDDNGFYCKKERVNDRTSIFSKIRRFYPDWDCEKKNWDESFLNAFYYMKKEIEEEIFHLIKEIDNIPKQKKIILDAYNERFDFHDSGKIIYLPIYFKYINFLKKLEQINSKEDEVNFVIHINDNNLYMISTVPKNNSTGNICDLYKKIAVGELLNTHKKLINRDDIKFVHKNRHIGSAQSLEGAIKLCELSLENKN
jgi:uncharacterized UPF0160 family protein